MPMLGSLPVMSGTPAVGSMLSTTTGSFVGGDLIYTYVWLRDGSPIGSATGSSYTVIPADAGHALSVRVTAMNGVGSASGTSAAVSVPAGPVAGSPGPVVSGTAAVGSTLSTTTGSFSGTGLTYTYVWQRDGSPIGGATSSTYTVVSADAGHALSVQVTATDGSGARHGHERGGEHPRAEQRRRQHGLGLHVRRELELWWVDRIGIDRLEREHGIPGSGGVSASRARSPRLASARRISPRGSRNC